MAVDKFSVSVMLLSVHVFAFPVVVFTIFLITFLSAVRLVGGQTPDSGRVELYHKGTWGTVCSYSWDLRDGHVVCRMLGYLAATEVKEYRPGTKPKRLCGLQCNGKENSLFDCPFRMFMSIHGFRNWDDAGVTCLNITTTGKKCAVHFDTKLV